MKNVFAPKIQNKDYDAKLIAGIERLSTVFRSLLQETAKEFNLTPLQTQLLIFIDEHVAKLCTVTSLSGEFSVTKATISDSLKTLLNKEFLVKVQNNTDARSFYYVVTRSSRKIVKKLNFFGGAMSELLSSLGADEKKELSFLTLKLLNIFQQAKLIPSRMCYSCRHFKKRGDDLYCELLEARLSNDTIRLDCPEYEN